MVNPFTNLTDEELMKLYQDDNFQAFEVIYSRYKDKVYSYLSRRIKQEATRADIMQNIFAKLHKSRMNYDPSYLLPKWIYTICKSELLDFFKKNKLKYVELNEEQLSFDESSGLTKFDIESEKSLSEKEKLAIELRYYNDNDFKDISKKLDISESNARKLISRGIKKLRTKYGEEY